MTDQRDAVRRGYDQLAEAYLDERSRDESEMELLAEFADHLPSKATVLDAGCGAGDPVTTALASDFDAVGLDISRRQLELAAENVPDVRILQGDLTALPFADDVFDGIVAFHSIIHVPLERHGDVYREFGRIVRPGGHALVTAGPGAWSGTNPDWLDAGAEMRWSFPDLDVSLDYLDGGGFEVLREEILDDEVGGGRWAYVLVRKRG